LLVLPDSEGSWSAETARHNPDLAKQLKTAYKAKFRVTFAQKKVTAVQNVCLPLTLIDVGGKLAQKNKLIMSRATHTIIFAGDMNQVLNWKKFCS
jgi:CRISPR-associated protein Csx3